MKGLFYNNSILKIIFICLIFHTGKVDAQNIFTGNLFLTSQAEVDSFGLNNYSKINGNLLISGEDITSLSNLSSLDTILGFLNISDNNVLNSLWGVHNIKVISGEFFFENNNSIYNLQDLEDLTSVGSIFISTNKLTSLNALSNITDIPGSLRLWGSENLSNIDGLSNITSIGNYLSIYFNNSLNDLSGLSNLTHIGEGGFSINENSSLTTLDGLSSLINLDNNLTITNNSQLIDYCDLSNLINNNGIQGIYHNENNSYNPSLEDLQNGYCTQNTTGINDFDIDINVYPNPFYKTLEIDFKESEVNRNIEIVNTFGQVLYEEENTFNQMKISTDDFQNGVYFLKVFSGQNIRTIKLIRSN